MLDSAAPAAATRLEMLVQAGGPVVVVLLTLSVLALAIILLKLWQFIVGGVPRERFIQASLAHWRAGEGERAVARLEGERSPVAPVLALAMRSRLEGRLPEPVVREEVTRVAAGQLEGLRGHLRSLEVIAALSPLLGLLGTVLGMIEAFRQLEQAGSRIDPALLSGGIWEALLTTAVGLAVAIPVVAVLNGLERMLERLRHRMEDAVTQVFTLPLPAAGGEREGTRFTARRAADAH
jgi:biopolymer transport protein ExbB